MRLTSEWQGDYVHIGLGLRLPEEVVIDITDWYGYTIKLNAAYSQGQYLCTSLVLEQDPDRAVPADLPDLPLSAFVQAGVYNVAGAFIGKPGPANGIPDDDRLRSVALLYKLAESVNGAPRKLIASMYDVSISTVSRWLSLAREKDFLDEVEIGTGAGRRRVLKNAVTLRPATPQQSDQDQTPTGPDQQAESSR